MTSRSLPLLALLLIGIGYLSLHRPLQAEKTTLEQRREHLTEQARLDREAAQLLIAELETRLADLEPLKPSLEARLPRTLNPSDTLALLRETAEANNVTVDSTRLEDPQQEGDLLSIATTITLTGTFGDLLAFVGDLETHQWPVTITSFSLNVQDAGLDPRLAANLALQLHAFNPPPIDPYLAPGRN